MLMHTNTSQQLVLRNHQGIICIITYSISWTILDITILENIGNQAIFIPMSKSFIFIFPYSMQIKFYIAIENQYQHLA
jgi:hypothetical protein